MKKYTNYMLALLVFGILMLLFNGSAAVLSAGAAIGGMLIKGYQGVMWAMEFLMDHLNFYSLLIYLIPGSVVLLWYYFAFAERNGMRNVLRRQTERIHPMTFVWLVLLMLATQHVTSLIMGMVGMLFPSALADYAELVEMSGLTQYSFTWVISTLILPPLVEEVAFRGLIYRYLRKGGACFLVANLIQAVCFGIYHMNFIQGIYTALVGFLFGYLAHRYQSLLIPMAAHGLFNLFGTVLAELESNFLPEILFGMLVLMCVPLFVVVLVMIHFGIGEKKRENRQENQRL